MLPPSMMPTPPTSVKKSSESAGNGNGSSHYDATTVEQIKAQFQAQIEAMMLSQVRNWLQAFVWVVHVHVEFTPNEVRDYPLRRRQIFKIFDPYPPPVGSFLLLSIGKFGQFLTPPPLKNADVLNGWSLFCILRRIAQRDGKIT